MGQSGSKKKAPGADKGFYLKHVFSDNDRKVFNLLGFTEDDMNSLHQSYLKVVEIKRVAVTNSKGAAAGSSSSADLAKDVRVGHLLVWSDEERSVFSSSIFSLFSRRERPTKGARQADTDEESGARINFTQFAVSLWNFCSVPTQALPSFVFNLYDVDSSGGLDMREVVVLLTHLYGNDFMHDQQVANLHGILEARISSDRDDATMDMNQFVDFCKHYPTLLTGAGKFQSHLVKLTLGQRAWDRLAAERINLSSGGFKSTHALLASNSLDYSKLGLDLASASAAATPAAAAGPSAASAAAAGVVGGGPRRKSDAGIPSSQSLASRKASVGLPTSSIAKAAAEGPGPRGHVLTKHKAPLKKEIIPDQKMSIEEARALLTGEKPKEAKDKAGLMSIIFGGGAAQPTPLPGDNAPPVTAPPAKAHKPLERKESLMMAAPAVTFKQQGPVGGQKLRKKNAMEKVSPLRRSISASNLDALSAAAGEAKRASNL